MKKATTYIFAVSAFFLPFLLYLKTLSPTYIPIDSAELALCMKYWGVCHPPGFPLYTLAGYMFVHFFPFGELIWKANLMSALFGAGTIFLVYLTLTELKVKKPIALATALLLAVSSAFWEFSTSADVFTFGTFFIALTFYLVFRKRMLPAFFALGLSASHFYLTAVLGPLVLWYFLRELESERVKELKVKQIVTAGIAFAAGFFPQALMYIRIQADPAVNWGHAFGLSGFWYFIRRQEFGSIFLLSNPVLKYTLEKTLKHFKAFFANFLTNFGIILPILAFLTAPFKWDRKILLLVAGFWLLVMVQLFLLSTIDPTGEDNPFQINKFYLSAYVIAALLIGISVDFLTEKFLGGEAVYALLLLGFLTLVYLSANYKHNDHSDNFYSQNMVLDAMGQLPENSVAIGVSHISYFGGRYEQEVNGKFGSIKLLYFPNEKNRDAEFYQSELFENAPNQIFIDRVSRGKNLGAAEKYVLEVISRNLDRDIYILQGSFEEGFFRYLKPYITPYGLWWRVTPDLASREAKGGSSRLMDTLRNRNVEYEDLNLRQQKLDTLNYAVSYHSHGVLLASMGKYDEAVDFLNKSFDVNPKKGTNVQNELDLIKKTRELEENLAQFAGSGNIVKLTELGNNYFTIENYKACIGIFGRLVNLDPKNAQHYNNLAACSASLGQTEEAKENYRKALELDPNLELAKRGLENLGND